MIKVLFEHDLAHNYMIPDYEGGVMSGEEEAEHDYEIHMLEENQIPGFLKCSRKKINGRSQYYYEITSRQSLAQICEGETLGIKDIRTILQCLYQALQQTDRYLLDGNKLVLEPECIYLDVESREASFCYLPVYRNKVQDSFRVFASFLLYHLNQADTEAVLLVYEINRKVQEKNYALMEILQKEDGPKEEVPVTIIPKETFHLPEAEEGGKEAEKKRETFFAQKETPAETRNKKKRKEKQKERGKKVEKKWIVGAVFLLVAGVTAMAAWMGALTVTQAGGITFLLAGGIGYAISNEEKHRRKQEKKEVKSEIHWEMPVAEEKREEERWEERCEERKETFQPEENVGATTILRTSEADYEPHMTLISMNSRERNSVVLLKDSYVIGKLKTKVDLWIDDDAISRIHAKIQKEGEEYYLYDMNSTNGTFLNGRRLDVNEKVQLHVTDEITFAGVGYYVGNC